MSFELSGLPDSPLIEKAYDFLVRKTDQDKNNNKRNIIISLHMQLDDQIDRIKADPKLSDEQKKQYVEQIEQDRTDAIMKNMPTIDKQVDTMAKLNISTAVSRALRFGVLSNVMDRDTLMSTSLVEPVVDSPMDYMDAKKKVGHDVAAIYADFIQLMSYPDQTSEILGTGHTLSKDFALMKKVEIYKRLKHQFENLKPKTRLALDLRTEALFVDDASLLKDASPEIKKVFVEAYNEAHSLLKTGFSVSIASDGSFELDTAGRTTFGRHLSPLKNDGPNGNGPFGGGQSVESFSPKRDGRGLF